MDDFDFRLPHPRSRLDRRAGARVHTGRRHRVRRSRAQGRPRDRFVRESPVVLLQCAQQFLRGHCEFPRRARLWARIMKERFNAKDERSMMILLTRRPRARRLPRSRSTTTSCAPRCRLAAVFGGAQSLHTNAATKRWRCPPSLGAVALRTQQVIAYESDVADTVDWLGGSWFWRRLPARGRESAGVPLNFTISAAP